MSVDCRAAWPGVVARDPTITASLRGVVFVPGSFISARIQRTNFNHLTVPVSYYADRIYSRKRNATVCARPSVCLSVPSFFSNFIRARGAYST